MLGHQSHRFMAANAAELHQVGNLIRSLVEAPFWHGPCCCFSCCCFILTHHFDYSSVAMRQSQALCHSSLRRHASCPSKFGGRQMAAERFWIVIFLARTKYRGKLESRSAPAHQDDR